MGAVALDASDRFQTNATQLASLAVLQLLFYASMQIPVGILLDRFGSRRLLVAGALIMSLGQMVVAFSEVMSVAVMGRILVGIGDACTFISMMRLMNTWYSGSVASRLQQWLATTGQLGQIVSVLPFALYLHMSSWESAFALLAATSVVVAVALWLFAAEGGDRNLSLPQVSQVLLRLRSNSKKPITWLAFFTHFTTASPGNSFVLLWGTPFMISALGYSPALAGGILTLFVVTNATAGPFIGSFCARFPEWRYRFTMLVVTANVLSWVVLCGWPAAPPLWFVCTHVMIIGVGGPASMIGFDYSKESFKPQELGAVNGLINVGAFIAALIMMGVVGSVIDVLGGPKLYSLDNFRIAFLAQLLVSGFGIAGLLVSRCMMRNNPRLETVTK